MVCGRCGFQALTEEQSDAYTAASADAYRRKHGLLTSQKEERDNAGLCTVAAGGAPVSILRDLRGQVFGRLTALKLAHVKHTHAYWLCQCECGERPVVRGTLLTTGRTVSCGCWRADPDVRRAAREQVPARRRRQIARMGARARWKK